MRRRGQAEMLDWLPRLVVLLVALLIVALIVRYYSQRDVDAASTDMAAYLARLERDPAVYAWEDPVTGRSTPGTIDVAKLSVGRLDSALKPSGSISSRVNVTGSCIQPFGDYHDRVVFDKYFAFAAIASKGSGSATLERRTLPVTLVNGNTRCAGTMLVLVVRPNTPSKVQQ